MCTVCLMLVTRAPSDHQRATDADRSTVAPKLLLRYVYRSDRHWVSTDGSAASEICSDGACADIKDHPGTVCLQR